MFGDVSITPSLDGQLFTNLVRNLNIVKVIGTNYLDFAGLHDPTLDTIRIHDTIVTSHNDTMLPNSTAKGIKDFFELGSALVGVDPSIDPQQLHFFMNVEL